MQETRSTCPYCGVGCGVIIESEGSQITGVRGDPDHPANFGRLCTKGSTLHLTATAPVTRQTRLLQPMQRLTRGATPTVVSWDAALDTTAQRLADIHRAHGPEAIGVYVSGQLLTEDYAVFTKLVKGLLGTNQLDSNSRLCMSSAVAGYKATLGADAPPCCYEDLDVAHTVFITGSNMAWAHPVLFRRLEDARRANPAQKWIVVDPRRTETAEQADLHLPLLPGTDVALYHGLLHLMLWEGWTRPDYIAAHTTGFDALKARVRDFTPKETARLTGLKEADLLTAARWFADSPATLSLYCQGLNQSSSGTSKNAALINLHLATGQIGKPGAGPLSLTGQPNAMGGREVGGMATLLAGHRDLSNVDHRAEVAAAWGVPSVSAQPGLSAVEMFQAAADGQIKALWIACTNPAQSLPDQATVRRALERAELVIVQEAFATTATCGYADVLLPATTWGEKAGTVTNSERRISRVRSAVPPAGEARHDWAIASDVGRRMAAHIAPERAHLFEAHTPEAIWRGHQMLTAGRDLDITGLSYDQLDTQGPQQWPLPAGAGRGTPRLYTDGRFAHADGKARFVSMPFVPVAEPRHAKRPFSLITGRLRDQWHGMSRTGTLGRLNAHAGDPTVQIHPQDLSRLRGQPGALLRVSTARGDVILPAQTSESLVPGQIFIAMHWGDEALGGRDTQGAAAKGVNALTSTALCPQSRQPELKHAAASLAVVDLPWRLVAMVWRPAEEALRLREAVKPWLSVFDMASQCLFGREPDADGRVGIRFLAAHAGTPDADLLTALRTLLLGDSAGLLDYQDGRRNLHRTLRVTRDPAHEERLSAFWLAGDAQGAEAMSAWLEADEPLPMPARTLLWPSATSSTPVTPRSPQVCACFNVREDTIRQTLTQCEGNPAQRLAALQTQWHCGTQCGSCLPALRTLVQTTGPVHG